MNSNVDNHIKYQASFSLKFKKDVSKSFGPRRVKTYLQESANNTAADQPAHPRRLISTFVIRFLEIIISELATSKISIFKLVSVAEEPGLNLAETETPKTDFLVTRPICCLLQS